MSPLLPLLEFPLVILGSGRARTERRCTREDRRGCFIYIHPSQTFLSDLNSSASKGNNSLSSLKQTSKSPLFAVVLTRNQSCLSRLVRGVVGQQFQITIHL